MGYMFIVGSCILCHETFTFNPNKVPSYRAKDTGEKEPICRWCMDRVNELRIQKGLKPFTILEGAYDPEPEY